jgi:hypothetical protein
MLDQISVPKEQGRKIFLLPQVISSIHMKLDVIGAFGGSMRNS